jgi:class 3 adenylate cyclase
VTAPPVSVARGGTKAASRFRDELAESIEHTLLEEARHNELLIAFVRASTLLLVTVGDWRNHLLDPAGYSIRIPVVATSWFALSLALLWMLRRYYHRALRHLLPILDGLCLAIALFNLWGSLGTEIFKSIGALTTSALGCGVFAATGALRLTRLAAGLTAGMAIAIYVGIAYVSSSWSPHTPIHCAAMSGIGLLSVWMTDIVRRAIQSEVGRSTLQRFLPKKVVTEAYATQERTAGPLLSLLTEPRSVEATILVSDLRGFTSMSEKLAPMEVLALLNEVQGALADTVREHGGTVDKFLGDGMLAVFGAPEPLDKHAAQAVAAAIAMRRRLAEINVSRDRRGEQPLRLGIGIHSGAVVTGCLGSGGRLEFTVIGDTVNTASRLEGLTKDKGVESLISQETVSRVAADDRLRVLGAEQRLECVGEVPIRGRREPLTVHTLREV